MKITIAERTLHFKQPAGTSRGVYTERRIWLVTMTDGEHTGVGECAPLPQLSCDDIPNYADVLRRFCDVVEQTGEIPYDDLRDYPSMLFGLETAWHSFSSHLLDKGFRCVKLKIGAIDFDSELALIKQIRQRFSPHDVELRVDANGAFPFEEALYKLELLSQYSLHSIEQPIKAGQWSYMSELCRESPLRIALDEELIGVNDPGTKRQMLNIIRPAYIILKPSLHGGMMGVREWVDIARDMGIGSWITSALESNVGLNAIAQLCSSVYGNPITMPQGLGTGQLFTDNIDMPLVIRGDQLWISNHF